MQIYRLSRIGYALAHSTKNPNTPEWGVIHYLAKQHSAEMGKILAEVQGASPITIQKLRRKGIIVEETAVRV